METAVHHYLMIKTGRVVGHIVADDADHAVTLKEQIDPDALLVCFAFGQSPRLMEREVKLIEEKVHG